MKKTLIGLLVLVMIGGMVSLAQAAPSVGVTVRVTITSALDITLVSGSLIDFGSMDPGITPATVNSSSTTIRNNGSGVAQTYKMYADSPGVWIAGGTADHNTYVLWAAFHGSEPADTAFASDDILGEDLAGEKTASSTDLSIDGTSTGLSVPYGEDRGIWYKFQPPSTSSLTETQNITVTITAIQG